MIRQGDIIGPLPVPVLSLEKLYVPTGNGYVQIKWEDVLSQEGLIVEVTIEPSLGIVVSQDCDACRAPLVTFCAIDTFEAVTGLDRPKKPARWVDLITKKSREYAAWFYRPSDIQIGFEDRMAVDFERVFQVRRADIDSHVPKLRKGRLNLQAYEHFRECIAQYYRRYPFDEWYPLDKEEFAQYDAKKGPAKPFDWQK